MKKQIVYIMGLGRSGTTLFDIILGNGESIFSAGELTRYPTERGFPYQYPVGHPTEIFWLELKRKFEERNPYSYTQLRWIRLLNEYHLFFPLNYWGILPRKMRLIYNDFNDILFSEIFNSSNCEVIVDSSKYPGRALTLSASKEFEFKFIYIKKEPLSVIRSFGKKGLEQKSKTWIGATIYYLIASFFCQLTYNRLKKNGNAMVVKYEDLINDTSTVLRQIQIVLGVDLSPAIHIAENRLEYKVGKIYYGNRVRLNTSIKLNNVVVTSPRNYKEKVIQLFCKYFY